MNKYKIESKKGEGTYSIVYLASDKETNEKYALKVMKYPYKDLSKIKKDKEIKALHMFTHPNIIKLIDVLYDEKQCTDISIVRTYGTAI
jgi:serine/threonine protein kinase